MQATLQTGQTQYVFEPVRNKTYNTSSNSKNLHPIVVELQEMFFFLQIRKMRVS
jgi:hypothetical protein